MMSVREKLVLLRHKLAGMISAAMELCDEGECCESCKYFHSTACTDYLIADHLIANGVTVQGTEEENGEWDWKNRHRGGFRRYTGVDDFGVEHTITVDERFECYDPYCPACGKLNEAIYLNFCPNCGKAMLPSDPPFVRRKPPKGE